MMFEDDSDFRRACIAWGVGLSSAAIVIAAVVFVANMAANHII